MKKLRVCLSMGGGVSLGAFSGAALTEALKLLVLYGRDRMGNPYDKIELDGMSGASAGSVSLAIMMRCLIDYKSVINKSYFLEFLEVEENVVITTLEKRIEKLYTSNALEDKNREIMLALEVTQIMQEIIWVRSIDTDQLFKESEFDPMQPFGLLNRAAILNLVGSLFWKMSIKLILTIGSFSEIAL
ncbi:MAG: hypothetical protein IPH93_03160 [Saprospiraceae bacterium]|nr:hypothetical protein [Saprospiraceae bacterium]